MQRTKQMSLITLCAAGLLAVAGCPSGSKLPGGKGLPGGLPGGGAASSVNPNTCGNYAASAAGRKLKRFLQATVMLQKAVMNTENYVKNACMDMARPLGISPTGNTKHVCQATLAELKNHMKVGLKAGAHLDVKYQPPHCEVNVDAAAKFAAKCEAKASADVGVRCSGYCGGQCTGQCSGTCNGVCKGTCEGSTGAGGKCNGVCKGTCEGSCSASCSGKCSANCQGHAEVDASASCKADAEVRANVDAKCTKPKLDIKYGAGIVVDKSKLEAAIASIKAGIPNLLMVKSKVEGPIKYAFLTWAKAARELAAASGKLYNSLGAQAACVSGQLAAAVAMIANIQASIDVQVSVSVEASASVSGGTQ